ncbi:hypothetical protein EV426DRAFT_707573 [Tirmania nivea]|nr:hypothetical protein EV426DRAFT_707573 [Tirmania nivea]
MSNANAAAQLKRFPAPGKCIAAGSRYKRRELIGSAATWEQLDLPIWEKGEEEEEEWDAVEAYFTNLPSALVGCT